MARYKDLWTVFCGNKKLSPQEFKFDSNFNLRACLTYPKNTNIHLLNKLSKERAPLLCLYNKELRKHGGGTQQKGALG